MCDFFFSFIVVAVVFVVIVCLFRIELSNAAAGTFLCVDTCVLAQICCDACLYVCFFLSLFTDKPQLRKMSNARFCG